MKKIYVHSLLALTILATVLTSCRSGRAHYGPPGPRYHSSVGLIIRPTPGFRMDIYHDGRSYYRSPEGYMYWRGYDNRFYLDRAYHNHSRYNQREYNEWRRYHNYRPRRRHR